MTLVAPDVGGTPGWFEPVKWLATVFGTVLVMLVGFRVWMNRTENRIDKIDDRVTNHENDVTNRFLRIEKEFRDEIKGLRTEIHDRHQENKARQRLHDRRQMFTLKLVADVARKIGVDNRVDDVVIGFLTADDGEDEESRR